MLTDAATLFIEVINNLKKGKINLYSPLEELVIKTCGKKLAYIDNRKDARQTYGFDFWSDQNEDWLKRKGIQKTLLYSQSNHFPDFLFKVSKQGKKIISGSLPRLRIMAEAHPEGNPHGNHYPEITNCSFNLILQSSPEVKELEKELPRQVPEIEVFSIFHKRNGEHRVFQFKKDTRLTRFVK